ncbi:histidine phosphatase family protein [Vibrio sp. CDRSL-10 TSBA]
MKKVLYLMRHGQTLFNVRRKMQGWCDSPLTELGIEQARQAAAYFDEVELTHLYSSSSERACDTAELATRNRMPYQRLKGLKEISFGLYEGESEDLHPDLETRENHYVQFGGESKTAVRERMVETCHKLMQNEDHRCVLAVSHYGACKQFHLHWNQDADPAMTIPNCAILKYQYQDGQFEFIEMITL